MKQRLKGVPWRRLLLYLAVSLAALATLAINAPGIVALYYGLRFGPVVAALPEAPAFGAGDRVLVLSPHPDDESLCCAGIIQRSLANGAEVFILQLTSGDGFEWDAVIRERQAVPSPRFMRAMGVTRMDEARRAAEVLGVPEANLFFLGYPDRGLLRLFTDHYAEPFRSRYTRVNRVPYEGVLSPGAFYTGRNLERDFAAVVDAVDPTHVLAPSPRDSHPDHAATAYLAMRLFGARDEADKIWYWIVHGGLQWPLPKGWHRSLPLFPPPRGGNMPWLRVDLTPEQVAVKEQAIRAHETQMTLLFRYLAAFVRTNELISPLPMPWVAAED